MLTKRIYLSQPPQFVHSSNIIGIGPDYVILDETIFHPQGGGQPSDTGQIRLNGHLIHVTQVKQVNDEIRHYVDAVPADAIGQAVECEINVDCRQLYARYHTGGHLISHIVESNYPKAQAIKGHHFPGESYVEFKNVNFPSEAVAEKLQQEISRLIGSAKDVFVDEQPLEGVVKAFPYLAKFVKPGENVRMIRVDGFAASPCSGTHVQNLMELNAVRIESCKNKNGILRVRYEIA